MSDEDEEGGCDCKPGAPLWMGTFADLMSLMLCFFLLILSFSVIDQKKYYQMVGDFKEAFGLQRQLRLAGVIELDGSPVMEHHRHVRMIAPPVQLHPSDQVAPEGEPAEDCILDAVTGQCMDEQALEEMRREYAREQLEDGVKKVLADSNVPPQAYEVERIGDRLHIRFPEVISFAAGGVDLDRRFVPLLQLVAQELRPTRTNIIVTGHSDDIPISTDRFRSNWDLSTARAVSVAEFLVREADFDPSRVASQGMAEHQPLVPNTTPENRARNRRVELVVELR